MNIVRRLAIWIACRNRYRGRRWAGRLLRWAVAVETEETPT